MERFKDKIHIAQYEALERMTTRATHVAHFNRGRGCKVYLCTKCTGIFLPNGTELYSWNKRRKETNFQRRSKYNIKNLT